MLMVFTRWLLCCAMVFFVANTIATPTAKVTARQADPMQEQQMLMLEALKRQLAALPPPDPKASPQSAGAKAQEQRRKELLQVLAEIEKRVNAEIARPKKRIIGPNTREEVFAQYYDDFRRKIEKHGTQNFPEATGNKLYGELLMTVTINHDGRVLETDVVESSGNVELDRHAQSIAKAIGLFDKFSDELRRRADQVVIVSRFNFKRGEGLEAKPESR
jgi:periplasmic protein TonB